MSARARLLAAAAVASAALGILPGAAGAAGAAGAPLTVRTPLPTTLVTSAGTWATVPMGHLDQALNTFWQLFFLPRGGARWTNDASALGVATNGGLTLAARGGSLLVGIAGAHLLHFSAVAQTADSGRHWATAAPLPGHVVALAADGVGATAVVTGSAPGGRLLATASGAAWRQLATTTSLAHSGARACRPRALTAVGQSAATGTVVGVACSHGGPVLFARRGHSWRPIAGPRSASSRPSSAVAVFPAGGGLGALVASRVGRATALVAESIGALDTRTTMVLRLRSGAQIASTGSTGSGGTFVLVRQPDGREDLAIAVPGGRWRERRVPSGTATVAVSASGRIAALAVHDTVMTNWTVASGSATWRRTSTTRVTIEFGSS